MESLQLGVSQINSIGSQVFTNMQKSQQSQKIGLKERKGSGSLFRGQNTAFQNGFQNQCQQNQPENLKNVKFWKIALILITFIQFSIKITVILIQYISSKIKVGLFCILTSTTLFLATLVFLSLKMLSIQKIQQHSLGLLKSEKANSKPSKTAEIQRLTLPRLINDRAKMLTQKTSKVLPTFVSGDKENGQTFKNFKKIQRQSPIKQNSYFAGLSLKTNLEIIIAAKTIENTVSLIGSIFLFCSTQNPAQFGFGQIQLLLTITFALVLFSSSFLLLLNLKIKQTIGLLSNSQQESKTKHTKHQEIKEIQSKVVIEKVQSALSIDNYIPNNIASQKKEERQTTNVERINQTQLNIQIPKRNLDQITEQVLISPSNLKRDCYHSQYQINNQNLNFQPRICKKPNIKNVSSKLYISKAFQRQTQINFSRRKVEIDEKKIQYFEYANIHPANSQILSQEHGFYSKILYEKAKLHSQRTKNFFNRKTQQEILLQRKRQHNLNRSISKSTKVIPQAPEIPIAPKKTTKI